MLIFFPPYFSWAQLLHYTYVVHIVLAVFLYKKDFQPSKYQLTNYKTLLVSQQAFQGAVHFATIPIATSVAIS